MTICAALPVPILLQVAEQADLNTVLRLSQTCKAIHNIVFEYEHSIARGRLTSGFVMPPLGPVLSSDGVNRAMIKAWTFKTVQDFELREHRITSIITTCSFLCTWKPESLGITNDAMAQFKHGIKRALYNADRLADVTAHYPEMLVGDDAQPSRNAKIKAKIRFRQVRILCSLPTTELAFLLALTTMAGRGYARYQGPKLEIEPDGWERVISFQEMILRHGSFSLWGFVRGPTGMTNLVQDYIASGVNDIREWECAHHVIYDDQDGVYEAASLEDRDTSWMVESLPGLHLTLMKEFRSRSRSRQKLPDFQVINEVISNAIGESLQV